MPLPLSTSSIAGREITILATDRGDGDIHPERVTADDLSARQIAATGECWAMLDEVHGIDVVDLDATAWNSPMVAVGDVAVATRPGTHLAVWTADCAALVLVADDGTVVGAHGGWRGLAAGVVDVAVETARRSGARIVTAVLGPAIGPCCYEFGADDLEAVAHGVHAARAQVTGTTRSGTLALDVPAAVRVGLRHHAIDLDVVGPCTGCDDRWYSHRVRRDVGRQATVAVIGP